jgi:hypothetical protein
MVFMKNFIQSIRKIKLSRLDLILIIILVAIIIFLKVQSVRDLKKSPVLISDKLKIKKDI